MSNRKHGYEMFLYTVRGFVKNVNRKSAQIVFNVEPTIPHVSDVNLDGDIKPSITLIGRRLINTEQGIKQEDDVFPVLKSATFVCGNTPVGMIGGGCNDAAELGRGRRSCFYDCLGCFQFEIRSAA